MSATTKRPVVQINDPDELAFDLDFQLGEGALVARTMWDDKLEFEIKAPGDDSRFQYIGMAEAAILRDWLGAWLVARGGDER